MYLCVKDQQVITIRSASTSELIDDLSSLAVLVSAHYQVSRTCKDVCSYTSVS